MISANVPSDDVIKVISANVPFDAYVIVLGERLGPGLVNLPTPQN